MNSSDASIFYNLFVCTLARCTPLMCYFMLALIHQCKIKDLAFLFNRKKKCSLSSITCLLVIYMYKHVFILFTEIKMPNICDNWDIQVRIWSYLSCLCYIVDISRPGPYRGGVCKYILRWSTTIQVALDFVFLIFVLEQ